MTERVTTKGAALGIGASPQRVTHVTRSAHTSLGRTNVTILVAGTATAYVTTKGAPGGGVDSAGRILATPAAANVPRANRDVLVMLPRAGAPNCNRLPEYRVPTTE